MSQQFKYLFTPFKLGPVTVKNRVVWLPHITLYGDNHLPSERHLYYYRERARGGVGLIVTECQMVHPSSDFKNSVFAFDERVVPIYQRIAQTIHEYGAKIFGQLTHYGAQGSSAETLQPLWAPSPVPDAYAREIPKEVEVEEIHEVVEGFAKAARHQKEGGYDGVEVKMAHDGIIRQFISPYSNRRTDAYGGSFENRMKLPCEVVDAIRGEIGDSLAFGIRLCLDEFMPGGFTLDYGKEVAKRLVATGKVDYFSPTLGTYYDFGPQIAPMYYPPGYAVYASAALKEVVDIPVFAFGRINDPVQAENVLAQGQADMVGLGRQLICDPEFAVKAREGRLDDIRACVACNQGCFGNVLKLQPVTCIHNPAAGREKNLGSDTIKPASVRKRVMVVGGGPGGLKAAEVTARRGHDVTLYERGKELGGQVNLAVKAPLREELGGVTRYLTKQVQDLGVNMKLGVEVTPQMVLAENPDAVVIATGSTPLKPDIPGINQENVVTTRDVLGGKAEPGGDILLFDTEGHVQGLGTADLLSERGKKVEVVTPLLYAGCDIDVGTLRVLYIRLREKGVRLTASTTVKEVSGGAVTVADVYSGEERKVEGVDTVVLATGSQAEDHLYRALKGKVKELHRVGDCVAPRKVDRAIYEANRVGRLL